MKKLLLLLSLLPSLLFSQNYVNTNPSFQQNLSGWEYGVIKTTKKVSSTPKADFEIAKDLETGDNVLRVKVDITTKENPNDVYLLRRGLKLKKGKKYRTNFSIKSTVGEDKFLASIGSGDADNFISLTKRPMKFNGNNEWQRVSFTFEVDKHNKKVDFNDLCLMVGFNHRYGTFYLKDFSIKPM